MDKYICKFGLKIANNVNAIREHKKGSNHINRLKAQKEHNSLLSFFGKNKKNSQKQNKNKKDKNKSIQSMIMIKEKT